MKHIKDCDKEIRELSRASKHYREIARTLGFSDTMILNYMKKHGINCNYFYPKMVGKVGRKL